MRELLILFFSDLAVIDVTDKGLVVRERVLEITSEELQDRTAAPLTEGEVRELKAPNL